MQVWATNNWMGFLIYAAVAILLAGLLQLRNIHKMMSVKSNPHSGFDGSLLRFVPVWILSVTGGFSFILGVVCLIVVVSK